MSMHLTGRVSVLEAEVKALRETLAQVLAQMAEPPEPKTNQNGPRKMCPHCGEVPNYFLHTRSCKGKKGNAPI